MKTIEESFRDWESHVFGYGYGTGEPLILPLLKEFFAAVGRDRELPHSYDYKALEAACGNAHAWFLINILCHADIIEYGTSPRYGWLTQQGEALKAFVATKSAAELDEICCNGPNDYIPCYPDACNCGPQGYQAGVKCANPFWISR